MKEELLNKITKEFFDAFYGLSKESLVTLSNHCNAYKVNWTDLFYCPSLIQEGKLNIIADKYGCTPKELWEYKFIWCPSDDKDQTMSTLKKVEKDIEIMSILNQSTEFCIP